MLGQIGMFPPLCCVGSRQISARALQGAFLDASQRLGFERFDQPDDECISAGLWDLGERGAWIYQDLVFFRQSAVSMVTLLAAHVAASAGQPLEVVLVEAVDGPLEPMPGQQAHVAYLRHRVYPDGKCQALRHPIADRLVGEAGLRGEPVAASLQLLSAILSLEAPRLEPNIYLEHQGTPRQRGLMVLLSETLDQPLRLKRRKGHFELELTHAEGQRLVHFLSDADLLFLQRLSPRFARLPIPPSASSTGAD